MFIEKFLPTARKRMHCIASDATLLQAARLLERGHDMLVVCDAGGRMVGVLTKTDAVRQIGICTGTSCTVTQGMTREVMTETPDGQLKDVWGMMKMMKGAYGWPRIWRELAARGIRAGKERVRRMMKACGLRARGKRRFKATTNSAHDLPVAPNLLARNFAVGAPNKVWTGDITYIWTEEGWLYLAVVIDLFNRQVVGFAMGQRMTRTLVMDALRMAWFRRHPAPGLIFHSNRGSQYASNDYRKLLRDFKMESSMSRKGDCWDNAVTETLFGSLKVERIHGMRFGTRRLAKDEVIDWIAFYNHRRLHSTLGYTSPMAFEQKWLASQISMVA